MTARKPKPAKKRASRLIRTLFDEKLPTAAEMLGILNREPVAPPETDEERYQYAFGGDAGLMAYRARMDLWKKTSGSPVK